MLRNVTLALCLGVLALSGCSGVAEIKADANKKTENMSQDDAKKRMEESMSKMGNMAMPGDMKGKMDEMKGKMGSPGGGPPPAGGGGAAK